jgi:hypothetical protein
MKRADVLGRPEQQGAKTEGRERGTGNMEVLAGQFYWSVISAVFNQSEGDLVCQRRLRAAAKALRELGNKE